MSAAETSEHAILTYVKVGKSIENLTEHHKSLVVKRDSPVSEAPPVDSVLSYPFVSFTLDYINEDCEFDGPNNTRFVTLGSPAIDAIRAQSQPSSGDQTDYTASLYFLLLDLKTVLEATLFIGEEVDVRLHKLAMVDEGGHIDWSRGSTQGKNHDATVLVALNTSWTGGAFHLRHDGKEMTPWHSTPTVELEVEPLTSGAQVVLQYDVFVCTGPSPLAYTLEDEFTTLDVVRGKSRMEFMGEDYRPGLPHDNELQYPSSSPGDVQALVTAIKKVISGGTEEIGIPLRHLYRQSSICKEHLKGVDSVIYGSLSTVFDISLVPMILHETSDHSSCNSEWSDSEPKSVIAAYKVIEGEEDRYEGEDEGARKRVKRSTEFHLSSVSDLVEINRKGCIECTSDGMQEAECKYFGGGMFLKIKKA
ncbi:hypothetical protein F5146DRAFT_1162410 [Armillaria mellea]|nr:hypothetical protein F5146DRAFT_1162410 [Armillaria mellea]